MSLSDVTAPPVPSSRALPEIGEVNVLEAFVGQRGTGKSTYECARAHELRREFGQAYVIGHSLGARLPKKLPAEYGGHELPISYHTSIEKLDKGLRSKPERWHILAPPIGASDNDTADDLIRYTIDLSNAVRDQAYRQKHGIINAWTKRGHAREYTGIPCVPIIMVIDEGIAIEAGGASKSDEHRWFYEFIFSIRHLHIAFLYSIQNGSARSYKILAEATTIHAFRTRHRWALDALRAADGSDASGELVDRVAALPKFKHISFGPAVDDGAIDSRSRSHIDTAPPKSDDVKPAEDKTDKDA